MAAIQGERSPGGFILITGIDGVRHAVRHNAMAVIHDADECRDETRVVGGAGSAPKLDTQSPVPRPSPSQPALRKPSSKCAWSSGRIHGTRLRTESNEPGATAIA